MSEFVPPCITSGCEKDDTECYFDPYFSEFDDTRHGGKVYFRQNKPGTPWYDLVSNTKGWTVDFDLTVLKIENGGVLADTDQPAAVGIYVNDGVCNEVIYFFEQEIYFKFAKVSVPWDTTQESIYRLTGQGNNLSLYARRSTDLAWTSLANLGNFAVASPEGNARKPAIFQDSKGGLHAAWHDDQNGGQIFYAFNSGGGWNQPELVISNGFGSQNADIVVDSQGNVYIAYEAKETDFTTVSFVVRNSMGWGSPTLLSPSVYDSKLPKLAVDNADNVHVVWEDYSYTNPEIFYAKFTGSTLTLSDTQRLTNTPYGSTRPSITTYFLDVYVSYTESVNGQKNHINVLKSSAGVWGSPVVAVSSFHRMPDYSNILAGMDGKIFVVWHDNPDAYVYNIFGTILNSSLGVVSHQTQISASITSATYPKLSLHLATGNIYVAWQDTREAGTDVNVHLSPYSDNPGITQYTSTIYVAHYDSLNEVWISSGLGENDVRIQTLDIQTMVNVALPVSFSGYLNILYEGQIAGGFYEYVIPSANVFSQIRNAVYDLTYAPVYVLSLTEYLNKDTTVSSMLNRKEIRFGHFSDELVGTYSFKNFRYYLQDAVSPFSLIDVSNNTFPIDEIRVNDSVVNNYGDVWLATICGMYFYFNNTKTLSALSDTHVAGQNIRALCFDRNGILFAATGSQVLYSLDHLTFKVLTLSSVTSPITALSFDKTNRLLVGTQTDGVYVVTVVENPASTAVDPYASLITLVGTVVDNFAIGDNVTKIQTDDNNVVWVTTYSGLFRYALGKTLQFTTLNGFATNRLNDISIRNTAIRYIASAAGIYKMVGTSLQRVTSQDGTLWNNNVKSIQWQDPNVIWAGTLSKINQIHEQSDGSYISNVYDPTVYSTFVESLDDMRTYFVVTDPTDTIPTNAEVEVYLNGNRVIYGYEVSLQDTTNRVIRFQTDLLPSDVVDVIIRKDLTLMADFSQSDQEKRILGSDVIRVQDLKVVNGQIYLVSQGDENEIKLNDSFSAIPYDCVTLDTTPPSGCIVVGQQIDSHTVQVNITHATDGVYGSGLASMIISNFPNFTTDGSTPQIPVPFATSAIQDLLTGSGNNSQSLVFPQGTGSSLKFFPDIHALYATTSKPGAVWQLNNTTGQWTKVLSFADDQYVDFVERFNNTFLVSVGSDTEAATIYVYVDDGNFASPVMRQVDGNRAYCTQELLNVLYIGTGPNGNVYAFDGFNLTLAFSNLSQDVYSMAATSNNILAGTGEGGRIYRLDPTNNISLISNQDSDSEITAMAYAVFPNNNIVFAGTGSQGKVLRTFDTQDAFNTSFSTTPSKVSSLFFSAANSTLYAAIGTAVFSFTEGSTWTYEAGGTVNILGAVYGDNVLYYLTATSVQRIQQKTDEYLTIYLRLIDKAGNQSAIFDSTGKLIPCRFVTLTIANLKGFTSANRLLQLDSLGNVVYTLSGVGEFYSANRIQQEEGIYDSQVFNGTNDIIKWDQITWISSEPTNTSVSIYLRASASETDILTEPWLGPFTRADQNGLDISYLTGQFIQFRAVLTSTVKGLSPSLSRVVITNVTSQSIHFFTTNFVLPSSIQGGILTSQKLLPVASDVVFGINTTNSVDWADYQIIDENRLFSATQFGTNLRVGIKLISPSHSTLMPADFTEYGPYNSPLFVNTVDFAFYNSGESNTYDYRVTLFEDHAQEVVTVQSDTINNSNDFSVDGLPFVVGGRLTPTMTTDYFIYAPPTTANINCDQFYFVKIEQSADSGVTWTTLINNRSFVVGCSPSYIDTIDFTFQNQESMGHFFNFRVRYYLDAERTNLFRTDFSGNDGSGWTVNGLSLPEGGFEVSPEETINVAFRPDSTAFDFTTIYYLTIDAYDGTNFLLSSNSYTFQVRDSSSLIYCGPYMNVPVVKNFALMFELINNQLLTLNLK